LRSPPVIGDGKVAHLYTAHILPNNTIEIYVDKVRQVQGNLLADFDPPVNPPKQIDDPTDKKPTDWVDDETIPDPEAKKPDDWDEDAPKYIPDPEATKSDEWDENAPEQIPDPEVAKPDDWNNEEDGIWQAPMIDNPQCQTTGCGKWKPPKIPNPEYKGKWIPPRIPNPAYKGKWKASQIDNPKYFQDFDPHNFAPIGGIGIEIWTMTNKITFDNIFIGSSLDEAFEFADKTWKVKYDIEKDLEEKFKARKDNPPLHETVLNFLKENVVIVSIVSFVVLLFSLLMCALLGGGGDSKKDKVKKEKKEEKEEKKEKEEEEEPEEEPEEDKGASLKQEKKGDNKTNIRQRKTVPKDK